MQTVIQVTVPRESHRHVQLNSGPAVCGAALLFAPSQDGISHNPLEWTDWEDCANAAQVLAGAMADVAGVDAVCETNLVLLPRGGVHRHRGLRSWRAGVGDAGLQLPGAVASSPPEFPGGFESLAVGEVLGVSLVEREFVRRTANVRGEDGVVLRIDDGILHLGLGEVG